jgi:hypothetical protein
VLPVTIDENITAIEGYGLRPPGKRIPQKKHESFFRGSEAIFFCFIIGDELCIRADFWTFLGVLQIELMTKGRNAFIRRTMYATLF